MSLDFQPAILERLSALPEQRVLDYFWMMNRQGVPRLWLLSHVGKVVIRRPLDWDRAVVRREHEQAIRAGILRLAATQCFGCMKGGPLYQHHIIEVQNGGSNDPRNRVALCFDCHKSLHPWLEAPKSTGQGLEHVRDFMVRAIREIEAGTRTATA